MIKQSIFLQFMKDIFFFISTLNSCNAGFMQLASELVVEQRGAVEEFTEKGLELLEIAEQDDIQGVTEDMDKVTGKYDDLKTTVREKLCQLNLTWQSVATNVRFYLFI